MNEITDEHVLHGVRRSHNHLQNLHDANAKFTQKINRAAIGQPVNAEERHACCIMRQEKRHRLALFQRRERIRL